MADIELVIKISEEDFEIMKHNIAVNNPLCHLSEKEMVATIANGIPLPQGHGRLIDADALLDTDRLIVDSMKCHYIPMMDIYDAPTIIEADRAERSDE